jgi:transposase
MHFVSEKTIVQQDIQAIHRIRQRLVRARVALTNEIRGLLSEYGIVVIKGVKNLRKKLPEILEDDANELTSLAREMFLDLYEEIAELDKRILAFDERVMRIFKSSEVCQRLAKIEGVGALVATAAVAAIGDPNVFKNGRQCSAWLGLVPRQHSSGSKTTLLGISKRGDKYLRMLLIHGGRSVVTHAKNKKDPRSLWVNEKQKTRGTNRAAVAVANKNVRIIWRLLKTGETYRKSIAKVA